MPTFYRSSAVVLIAALSVFSGVSSVAAFERYWERAEPVTVTNKATNPVPVSVQGTVPVTIVGGAASVGGGGGAAPEDGAQFYREGVNFVMVTDKDLARTGKRFVVDFLTVTAALPSADCSMALVRVYDGAFEYARTTMSLQGNAMNLFGGSQSVKMFVDPGQRIDALVFATTGCNATDLRLSVVGHYVDH